jgi:hypothetical protein
MDAAFSGEGPPHQAMTMIGAATSAGTQVSGPEEHDTAKLGMHYGGGGFGGILNLMLCLWCCSAMSRGGRRHGRY